MAINTACRVRVQWRNVGVSCLLLAATLLLLCCGAGTADGAPTGTFPKLFTFGDSYVDTGNRDPNNSTGRVNQPWRPPYGRKRPGTPAGHFSDGDVLSERLGKYMGLTPATYMLYLSNSSIPIGGGMNFAVGGAGVFENLGFTKTRDQIAQFKALVDANVYNNASVFSESVVLFAISGNDYGAFVRDVTTSPLENIEVIILSVVEQIVKDLKSLYDMGFRNFVISELEPLSCLASTTSACLTPVDAIATPHNIFLNAEVAAAFPNSTGANVILLDNHKAFYNFLKLPLTLPLLGTNPRVPCCRGNSTGASCGDVDSNNNPLYTLCSPTTNPFPFFWDEVHPSEDGWRRVFDLYVNDITYSHGKSLPTFLGV